MSLAEGGAEKGPSGPDCDLDCDLSGLDGPRRSLRRREEKSYAESPDLLMDEDRLVKNAIKESASEAAAAIQPFLSKSVVLPCRTAEEKKKKKNSVNNGCSMAEVDTSPPAEPKAGTIIENGDIDMESDIEEDEVSAPVTNMALPKEWTPEELFEKREQIKQLQTKLRNEEMSLVLLKKIRQSQVLIEQAAAATAAAQSAATAQAVQAAQATAQVSSGVTIQPAKNNHSKSGYNRSSHSNSVASLNSISAKQILTPDLTSLQPVNVDPKNHAGSLPANFANLVSGGKHDSRGRDVMSSKPKDSETPAQKQAAAKLALRKQLEKTLLQIPPPKPPPPEMHFIPNPTNTEFVCLLGLEECVSKILNEDKENSAQPIPFSCSQCDTDFTPTWKWDKGSRGKEVKVICENCVTTNVKKALKAEHTNRLKAAFVKALQQEQELEAHMAAAAAAAPATSAASSNNHQSPRVASPDTRHSRTSSGLDVTIRPATSNERSANRASTPSSSRSAAAAAAAQLSLLTGGASITPTGGSSSRGSGSGSRSQTPSNNSRHRTSSSANSHSNGGTSSSSNNSATTAGQQAAMLATLMGMGGGGGGGYDMSGMASIQQLQQLQQQMMMLNSGAVGTSASASGNGSSGLSSSRGSSSNSSSSNSNAAAAAAQLAAMNQMMNPLYSYQLAMAQAMQQQQSSSSSAGGGSSSSKSASNSRSNAAAAAAAADAAASSSATNQMMEIQRQAAEQIHRQYLLDMIPPGGLSQQSWSGKK